MTSKVHELNVLEDELRSLKPGANVVYQYDQYTRQEISRFKLPPIGFDHFIIVPSCGDEITDPLRGKYIPPEEACAAGVELLSSSSNQNNGMVMKFIWGSYTLEGLVLCRRVHTWQTVADDLERETKWCHQVAAQPWCSKEFKENLEIFLNLISNTSNGILRMESPGGDLSASTNPDVLRTFACNYTYSEKQFNCLSAIVNSQSDHLYVLPTGAAAATDPKLAPCRYYVLFIRVVFNDMTSSLSATDDVSEKFYWALCVYDNTCGILYYGCDKYLWLIPSNISDYVSVKVRNEVNTVIPMHYTETDSQDHVCSTECFLYPLNVDGDFTGVVPASVAVFLAGSVDDMERFVCRDRKLFREHSESLFLENSAYMRCAHISMVISKSLPSPEQTIQFAEILSGRNLEETSASIESDDPSVLTPPPVPFSSHEEFGNVFELLPDGYRYILEKERWIDVDSLCFTASLWLNVVNVDEFETWLKIFQDKTRTIYTCSRVNCVNGNRVKYRARHQCVHGSQANFEEPVDGSTVCATSRCKACIDVSVFSPDSKFPKSSTPCLIGISNKHCHKIEPEVSVGVTDLPEVTKRLLFRHYSDGLSPKSAKNLLKKQLPLKYNIATELLLANRMMNPSMATINWFWWKWKQVRGSVDGAFPAKSSENICQRTGSVAAVSCAAVSCTSVSCTSVSCTSVSCASGRRDNVEPGVDKCNEHTYAAKEHITSVDAGGGASVTGDIFDVLPEGFTYKVDTLSWRQRPTDLFVNEVGIAFKMIFWINISNSDSFEAWLKKLEEKTKSVYRVTRTYRATGQRITYSTMRHCQHRTRNYYTKPPPKKKVRHCDVYDETCRSKGVDCKAYIKATIYTPECILPERSRKTPCRVNFENCHTHPTDTAHFLSFRDVSSETKAKFLSYFLEGCSVAVAKQRHEAELCMACKGDEYKDVLADRSINPFLSDLHRLRRKWLDGKIGLEVADESLLPATEQQRVFLG